MFHIHLDLPTLSPLFIYGCSSQHKSLLSLNQLYPLLIHTLPFLSAGFTIPRRFVIMSQFETTIWLFPEINDFVILTVQALKRAVTARQLVLVWCILRSSARLGLRTQPARARSVFLVSVFIVLRPRRVGKIWVTTTAERSPSPIDKHSSHRYQYCVVNVTHDTPNRSVSHETQRGQYHSRHISVICDTPQIGQCHGDTNRSVYETPDRSV